MIFCGDTGSGRMFFCCETGKTKQNPSIDRVNGSRLDIVFQPKFLLGDREAGPSLHV